MSVIYIMHQSKKEHQSTMHILHVKNPSLEVQ